MQSRYRVSCSTASIVPTALDLDCDPAVVGVAAHQVDRADVGRPLALDEPQVRLDVRRVVGEQELQVALDAVLLEPGGFAHVVHHVGQHLDELDLEPVLGAAGALAHDDQVARVLDHGRRRHPVQGLHGKPPTVRPEHDGAVLLDHQQADTLGEPRGEAAGVGDLAAGDDQTHGGEDTTVPFGQA